MIRVGMGGGAGCMCGGAVCVCFKNIASISTLDGMMNIKRNTKITLFPKP